MNNALLPSSTLCLRCCIKAIQAKPCAGARYVSRTSAINRGLRATKGPSSFDRRRPDRALSARRDGQGRRRSTESSGAPRTTARQSDIVTGPRDRRRTPAKEDDEPLAFRRRDKVELSRDALDNARPSSRTKRDMPREKGSYSDWLASRRSDREKRSQGIRERQGENSAQKRDHGRREDGHSSRNQRDLKREQDQRQDMRGNRKPHELKRDQEQQQDVRGNRDKHELKRGFSKSARREAQPRMQREEEEEDEEDDDGIPVGVPYSTASSQFLYGTNAVLAALRGKRRELYVLHIRQDADQRQALALAKSYNLKIKFHDHSRVLDRMSDDRPHNGVVLETSSIPAPMVLAMGKVSPDSPNIPLYLSPESSVPWSTPRPRTVGASQGALSYPGPSRTWRQPFIVFLDGITDPGNVGSILRTAHFFGVDAVAIATNTCANINSPVLAKASAGACEAVPVLSVSGPASFIHKSAEAGWKIYAAIAPEMRRGQKQIKTTSEAVSHESPLLSEPVILMLGAEGEGLRENLRNKAHVDVSVARPQNDLPGAVDVGVDSMNVGVAAGVLIDAFMRRPHALPESSEEQKAEREAREGEKLF